MSDARDELKQQHSNGNGASLDYEAELAALRDEHPDERKPVFNRLSFDDVLALPDKQWLFDGLIGKQDIAMIFGEAASGKTFAVIDLLFAASMGLPFGNQYAPKDAAPLTVAYCTGEGTQGIKGRFAAAFNHYGNTHRDKAHLIRENLHTFLEVPQLYDGENAAFIQRFIEDWQQFTPGPLDILVIDTLHTATIGAEENSNSDMREVFDAARRAVNELGCTVLLVHHVGKNGKFRGASAMHGACDTMIQVSTTGGGVRKLDIFKLKDGNDDQPPLYYRIQWEAVSDSAYVDWIEDHVETGNSKDNLRDAVKSEVLKLLNERDLNQSEIARQIESASRTIVLEVLNDLVEAGLVVTYDGPRNAVIYQLKMDI